MFRGLVLAVAVAIVGLVAVGLVGGQQWVEAQRQTASATRSLPSEVEPGDPLVVTITVANYGGLGQLTETFPAGFTFVESSPEVTPSGQSLTFNLVGDSSVSYTLTAPTTTGRKTGFSGTLDPAEGARVTVDGPSSVTVSPPAAQQTASATRSLPSEVEPGDPLVVTITVANYGGLGQLTETFPAGFTFVESSPEVTPSGQSLTFNLVGDSSVSYTLTAPTTTGRKTGFSGTLDPAEGARVTVDGPSSVTVEVAATPPVEPVRPPPNNRAVFSSAAAVSVAENTTVVVTVRATDRDSQDRVTGYAIIGGADRAKFQIVSNTGELSFTTAPDFENPADADADNEYVVTVRATSGVGGRFRTATQTIRVTVTDVAEAPALSPYDVDDSGVIEGPEVIQAVKDYFADTITGPEVIEVVKLYFAGRSN